MSVHIGNNNRNIHGDRYLHAYRARQSDRGRKNLDDGSMYKQEDFLHDSHQNNRSENHAPVSLGSTRETKFKPGFHRRHVSKMDFTSEREIDELRRAERFKDHVPRRLGNILANDKRNGDILAHGDLPPSYRPWRNISQVNEGRVENENTKRQMKDPTSRFHALITAEQRERHRQRRELIQKGLNPASSDIGVGRRDIASNGVADNFSFPGHGEKMTRISRYGRATVDSKAKLMNFHIGEAGVSRGNTPKYLQKERQSPSPAPNRYLAGSPLPQANSPAPNRFLQEGAATGSRFQLVN